MTERDDLLLSFELGRLPITAADELVDVCRANGFEPAPFDDERVLLRRRDVPAELRNDVADDGHPIGDLPSDWPAEHELLSLSLDYGLLTKLGPGRFYMPDASGEQVSDIAEMFGLQRVPEEMSLWAEIDAVHE